jgi:filamentous hemagglutinin family protein
MKNQSALPQQRRTLLSLAVALAVSQYGAALAAPVGQQVVSGQVTVTRPDVLQTVISQASQSAIVNWQQFSIGAAEHVDIRQPNASSVLLNRVIGNNPSEIYGRLSANGQVFLVNPNGVLFGRTAQVSVGGLVASTLDIANDDFLAGRYQFHGSGGAAVDNFGNLQAVERGTVALLGGRVNNDGTISARLGTAALAAGEKITLDFEGDGLTQIRVDQGAVAALVANRGLIVADGGQAVMTAGAAQALADTVLNQQGVIRARSLVERDGKIVLDGGAHGVTLNSGTLDVSGVHGGTVNVLGHHVGLVGNALIDASGEAGGGQVYVGGGVQGGNPLLRHAAAVFAGAETRVRADALGSGNGGTVVLWSDGSTRMFGAASATGGARGGDGGFIETSGKFLDVAGMRVDAAATRGKAGTWLLDPYNIDIVGTAPTTAMQTSPNFVSDASTSELWNVAIMSALDAGTSVTVTTGPGGVQEGDINVSANILKQTGGDASLTLNAANNINIGGDVQITSLVGALNLDLNADADNAGGGTIDIGSGVVIATNGGNVRMYGQGDPVNGFASGSSSDFADGITINGANINTTTGAPDGGGGNIVIRGRGLGYTFGGAAVTLNNSVLTTGNGSISVTGIGGEGQAGVVMFSPVISTTGGGSIDIRGLALADDVNEIYNNGIYADDATISASGALGNIMLSGEAVGAAGMYLGGTVLGNSVMLGNITLRAFNTPAVTLAAPMIELPSSFETFGVVGLRPGGVSATGALTAKDNVAINLGNYFVAAPPPGEFSINELILGSVVGPSVSAVVLGSDTHTGLISVTSPTALAGTFGLTLQNGGAGSAGISLLNDLNLSGRTLTLSSGGDVTQAGAISADGLLLHGTQSNSNFQLNNSANSVTTLSASFDQLRGGGANDGDVRFANNGALQLGPLSGVGFYSSSNLAQSIDSLATTVTGDLGIQASGDLTLAQPLTMMGLNVALTLHSDNDLFANSDINLPEVGQTVNLTATRDMVINTVSAATEFASLSATAGRDLTLAGSLNALGSDTTVTLSAGGGAQLDGAASIQGDRSSLTVNAVNYLSASGNIAMDGNQAVLRLNANGDADLNTFGTISMAGADADMALTSLSADLRVYGTLSMTGSNPLLRLNAGNDLRVDADVGLTGSANVQALNAGNDIVLESLAHFFSTSSGPLQLDLNADADNLNQGAITVRDGASIVTNGGDLRMYGQSDALAGYASGSSESYSNGIALSQALIDTGAGALTMRGRGNLFFEGEGSGILYGSGVVIFQSDIISTSGALSINGLGSVGGDGVSLIGSSLSTSGGALDVRGRSGAPFSGTPFTAGNGVTLSDATVNAGGGATTMLSGESEGASGIAILGDTKLGLAGTSGNIVLRAFNTGSSAPMLSLGGTIQTSGVINLRPGGVSATGVLTEQPATVINLGGAAEFASLAALDAAVVSGSTGVVIGSAAHSGAININAASALGGQFNLSLQNDAAGSAGINLLSDLSLAGATLTLSSGGAVTQAGALNAGGLLLHGAQPESSFVLTNPANTVATLSANFDCPAPATTAPAFWPSRWARPPAPSRAT